jgi:hypothetical protein
VVLEAVLEDTRESLRVGATLHLPQRSPEATLAFYRLAAQDATGARANEHLICLEQAEGRYRQVPNHILLDAVVRTYTYDPPPAGSQDDLEAHLADTSLIPFLEETITACGQNVSIRARYAEASYHHQVREMIRARSVRALSCKRASPRAISRYVWTSDAQRTPFSLSAGSKYALSSGG